MGRVIMNGPPPGRNYCIACLMQAKQRQGEAHQDDIQKGHAKGGDELTVIPWPAGLTAELLEGDYRAVCGDFPAVGVVDGLCWSHVAGINPSPVEASRLDVPPGLSPAGRRGRRAT